MSENNKAILEAANAAIAEGNNEGFLSFCADDVEWMFVSDKTLKGKDTWADVSDRVLTIIFVLLSQSRTEASVLSSTTPSTKLPLARHVT
jgi:hypothetical protein